MDESQGLIRRYFETFNAFDRAGMLACLSDDIVHDVNQGERRLGKSQFAAFLQRMDHCYREQLRDIVIMTDANGGRASAEFVVHGHYIADDEGLPPARGQSYVLPAGTFFEIVGGKITRVTTHYNLNNWISQVAG